MGKKPETVFAEKVDRDLAELGGIWFNIQQVAVRGTPDRVGCFCGKFIALELKVKGGRLAPLQQYYLDRIADHDGYSAVVTPENWPTIKAELGIIKEDYTKTYH